MEKTDFIVYRHICPNGKVYIGVTNSVKNRWKPSNYKKRNTPFKDAIIEFGWDAITHEVIASGLTYESALKLEDMLIIEARERGVSLNVKRSGQCTKDCKAYNNAWGKNHREKRNAYQREYMREYRKRKKE